MISAAIIALRIPSCIGSSGRQHAVDRSLADAQLYRDLAHAQPFIRKSLDLLGLGCVAIGSYRGLTAPADWRLPRTCPLEKAEALWPQRSDFLPSIKICYTTRPSRWALTGCS